MNYEEFIKSFDLKIPPHFSRGLLALWYDKNGNWEEAHSIAQEIHNTGGSWIHAYLHRKEGDYNNAGYWYSRAGKLMPDQSLDAEWDELVRFFLSEGK